MRSQIKYIASIACLLATKCAANPVPQDRPVFFSNTFAIGSTVENNDWFRCYYLQEDGGFGGKNQTKEEDAKYCDDDCASSFGLSFDGVLYWYLGHRRIVRGHSSVPGIGEISVPVVEGSANADKDGDNLRFEIKNGRLLLISTVGECLYSENNNLQITECVADKRAAEGASIYTGTRRSNLE